MEDTASPEVKNNIPLDKDGRYVVEPGEDAQIGKGGFGSIFKAYDTHLDKLVAIKGLPLPKGSDTESEHEKEKRLEDIKRTEKRAKKEAKVTANLEHPNIISVNRLVRFEHKDKDGKPGEYIGFVMNYKDKRSNLKNLIESNQLTSQAVETFTRQVGALIDILEINHRDMTPQNFFLEEFGSGELKYWNTTMIDFGISSPMGKEFEEVLGTPLYMPPEALRGQEARSGSVYMLASMVYEMVTGQRLREGDIMPKVLSQALTQDGLGDKRAILEEALMASSKYKHINQKEFVDTVDKALKKDPDARFQSGKEFANALFGEKSSNN